MTTAAGHSLDQQNGTSTKVNAWQQPGPSAFDFRSDTMTTPTAAMLEAISNTTLLDDVFLEDPTTQDLEAHIAQLTGHEAALLIMSGTMGNQVSLRTHLSSPPHSVVCDIRSHIMNYEAGGISTLSSAMLIPVHPSNNHHLTLADLQKHTIVSDNIHACPTRVISLENTLNGLVMPLAEARAISAWAKSNNILLHLDGARIWEVASTHTHGSIRDYCTLFDSVSLCFSKGLGAPIGSIIVGSTPFITHARRIRKMFGGGTRQAGVISAAARCAVDTTFGSGPNGAGGKLHATHLRAKAVAKLWQDLGGALTNPVETNMVWLDLKHSDIPDADFVATATRHGLKMFPGRVVVHYQISDEAVERLATVFRELLSPHTNNNKTTSQAVNGVDETKGPRSQYE